MKDDAELLHEYAERRSELAFKALVERHVDMVYSTALRRVSDSQLARDVVQVVFIELAQKPKAVRDSRLLAGWLYRVAGRTASNVLRTEARRRQREEHAMQMNARADEQAVWPLLAPHLEQAIDSLEATDQNAILLRFFERRSFRQVGEALSITEDAAQKRVSRALEKMRHFFERYGITVGGSGLATVISANAVQTAPAGFAVAVATAASSAGTAITLTPIAKLLAMTTLQKTFATIVVTIAVGVALYQTRQNSRLVTENRKLREQAALASEAPRQPGPASEQGAGDESMQLRQLRLETLRLRAEVARLRSQNPASTNVLAAQTPSEAGDPVFSLPILKFSTKTSSPIKPGETLITGGWPADNGNKAFMLLTLDDSKAGSGQQLAFRGAILEMTDRVATTLGLERFVSDATGTTPSAVLEFDPPGTEAWLSQLKSTGDATVVSRPSLLVEAGREASIFIGQHVPIGKDKYASVGQAITLLPFANEDGVTVSVTTEIKSLPDAR